MYQMIRKAARITIRTFWFFVVSIYATTTVAATALPSLGDAYSGLISLHAERQLGLSWLNQLRKNVPTISDPEVVNYVNTLIYKLVPNTDLKERRIVSVIVDSSKLNAFAVPGGILGINAGLFLHADNEQKFASVIAHELGHMSQRHYARSLQRKNDNRPLALAGFLASMILAATTGSNVGMAALAGTQALRMQSQLHFSRQNEREADRAGIKILYKSGFDPKAMPEMFEEMQKESRLNGGSPPEYLSTHPVTESRISDSMNRARQYPKVTTHESLEYHLMRARIFLYYAKSVKESIAYFTALLKSSPLSMNRMIYRYGLLISLIKDRKYSLALKDADLLVKQEPGRIAFAIAKARVLEGLKQNRGAVNLLKIQISYNPDNYPLNMALANALEKNKNFAYAEKILVKQTYAHPLRPEIWHKLSEVAGLNGDIIQVHRADAEYFYLTGDTNKAIKQLNIALKKAQNNDILSQIIQTRLSEFYKAKKNK